MNLILIFKNKKNILDSSNKRGKKKKLNKSLIDILENWIYIFKRIVSQKNRIQLNFKNLDLKKQFPIFKNKKNRKYVCQLQKKSFFF